MCEVDAGVPPPNSLTVKMEGLDILQPSRESPLTRATSRDSTAHAVAVILGEGNFGTPTHATTLMSGQNKAVK